MYSLEHSCARRWEDVDGKSVEFALTTGRVVRVITAPYYVGPTVCKSTATQSKKM
jgi:hypothetical protein